ncbi:phosphomannomutase [Longibacter salinarum]|uniref:Phosphomannomutase n=1 Tax=Longibacter salinarum TaxID=1850348 RepID=A0A2A8CZ19_9BACT|nr:phosphoglucomutase/phosphomannomutase family protein [Longibacter salinarum]PEN13638.1 phosphomannomutase [Longibacter salinarum]
MAETSIKFGTDGWRAVIAREYTFDNLERVARATAAWLHDEYGDAPRIVIGHDTRFLGREFATFAARVLADAGVHATLTTSFLSTPAISWATQAMGCDAGIVITASHNPPEYNGYKIKANFGGPAPPAMISAVEEQIPHVSVSDNDLPSAETFIEDEMIALRDVRTEYLDAMRDVLDIEAIAYSDLTVVHDAMFGAGQGIVTSLLGTERVVELHHDLNPGFHGTPPEPIDRNLAELQSVVGQPGHDVGIANDGDADRIGMVDENGDFVDSHRILALLVKYLHEERGLSGSIVKTFSTTHMLNKMADAYGFDIETVPIGFKHIAPKIAEGGVLVGGEESGGIAASGHIPERDGIYIGLLIVEMMVKRGMKLSELVDELLEQFGPHYCYREDIHISDTQKQAALKRLSEDGGLDTVNGHVVVEVDTLDGYKHLTDGNGWLLIRPSGTEPVLRVYSEAETPDAAKALVQDARAQLNVG